MEQEIESWAAFFAEDTERIEYRHTHPPCSPNRMVGREEIRAFLVRVKGSHVALAISDEVIGPARAAFCVTCALADGAWKDHRARDHYTMRKAASHARWTRKRGIDAAA